MQQSTAGGVPVGDVKRKQKELERQLE